MASEIRANKSTNRAGLGTVTYADTGIIVSGIVTCTELSGLTALNISGVGTANTLDINGDIDVDGHTNLDNVSVAGIATFSGILDATNTPASIRVAQDIQHKGDADTKITFPADNTISFDTAGSERLRIKSNGELEISPGGFLTIDTNPAATYGIAEALRIDDGGGYTDRGLQIFEYSHNGSRYHRIQFNLHTTTNSSAYTYTQGNYGGSSLIEFHNSGPLVFYADAQDANGSTSSITPTERLRINTDGNIIAKSATQFKGFTLRKADGGTVAQLVGHASDNDEGGLNLWDGGTKKVQILANGTSYLTGGTVGINDSSPNTYFKLDVNGHTNIVGDIALPTTNRIYWGTSDTAFIKGEHGASAYLAFGANNEQMRLTRSGRLGIGTDNPSDELHIFSSNPGILITDSDQAANTKNWSITAGIPQTLRIQAQDDSNAGGGNIFDFYKVTNQINEFRGLNSGNTWFVVDNNNKRVGINTDIAGTTLDVFGILQVKDTTGKQNLHVSTTSFKYSQSTSGWSNMNYASNPIFGWDYKNGPGDLMYMASGGNTATADQMALVVSDVHGFKVGRSGYDGTDMDVSSSNEFFRISPGGKVTVNCTAISAGGANPQLSVESETGSNIGIIQVHAGSGETNGDLSGIAFSHGNTGTVARPKAAIALRAIGSYGRGDLCFYVDGASDNNAVSSGDEKLRITKEGYVTKPEHPAFFATHTGTDASTSSGDLIQLTTTRHNKGNCYSTSNYYFTAPVAGVYHFTGQVWSKNGSNHARWQFSYYNGSSWSSITQHGFHGNSVNKNDFMQNASITYYMNSGDRMGMRVDNATLSYYRGGGGAAHTYFCGHLVG